MHLTLIDWTVMVAAFAVYVGIGLWVGRSAGKDYNSFFLSGRSMPWWLLGTSMVATTFATDTPNLVTGFVREDGVYGNWKWWAFALTGTLTVFLFAKLWRRSQVLTDVEFYELRYSGKPAAFLRGFRAVYLGVFFNVMIMANVTLAAIKIGGVLLGLSPLQTIAIAATVTLIYSTVGGLTGVLLTDLVQFALAMIGSIGAAWFVTQLPEVGGLTQLLTQPEVASRISLVPDFSSIGRDALMTVFLIPLLVQWWSTYYPGAEPGGGGYIVQRILAAKDEKHAAGAALLFNTLHYGLRPWPWIVVALCSLVVFPDLASLQDRFPAMDPQYVGHDMAYPAMLTYLPAGLLGIVVTSLIAAYMSTMSTQVNWGSSVLVNDVYRRFINPSASQQRLVWMGRLTTLGLMVLSCGVALLMRDAVSNFEILLQIGAGTGLIFLVRWFWWRVNAFAEMSAMATSFLVAVGLESQSFLELAGWQRLLLGVGITTTVWIAIALLTPATHPRVLQEFVRRLRPGGPGWRAIEAQMEPSSREESGTDQEIRSDLPASILCAFGATLGIWALIFTGGMFLYGRPLAGLGFAAIAATGAWLVASRWKHLKWR